MYRDYRKMPKWPIRTSTQKYLPDNSPNLLHEVEFQNPVNAYPAPPFTKQRQPWPGLASQMDPRPDHGETTYVGSGRLLGRKALITGGDSGIGRAVAIAFAREGADVAINYYPPKRKIPRSLYRGP